MVLKLPIESISKLLDGSIDATLFDENQAIVLYESKVTLFNVNRWMRDKVLWDGNYLAIGFYIEDSYVNLGVFTSSPPYVIGVPIQQYRYIWNVPKSIGDYVWKWKCFFTRYLCACPCHRCKPEPKPEGKWLIEDMIREPITSISIHGDEKDYVEIYTTRHRWTIRLSKCGIALRESIRRRNKEELLRPKKEIIVRLSTERGSLYTILSYSLMSKRGIHGWKLLDLFMEKAEDERITIGWFNK